MLGARCCWAVRSRVPSLAAWAPAGSLRWASSPARSSSDVVVVGGGVVGSAVAFNLAKRGVSVTVVEREPTYAQASTTLSAGGIRSQFSNAVNTALSLYTAKFVKDIAAHLEVDGQVPEVNFREGGYLFLASGEAGKEILHENHKSQLSMGAEVALLNQQELGDKFPWLDVSDIVMGGLGLKHEGWIDPHALLLGFRNKAKSLGARFVFGSVASLTLNDSATAVQSANVVMPTGAEETIGCGVLVNAAGPSAGAVSAMANIVLPVVPRKRCVFVFSCKTPIPNCPFVVDPSGVYFRPESSGNFICGTSPPADRDTSSDWDVEHWLWDDIVWPALATRVPAFDAVRLTGAWAGHYDYNTFDQNAVVGFHPHVSNFLFANGFSGHGLQQAPAVGFGVSELICDGKSSLDMSALCFERIAEGRPLLERNIV